MTLVFSWFFVKIICFYFLQWNKIQTRYDLKKPLQLRLYSDHHHFVLEKFSLSQKTWQFLAKTEFEYVTEQNLTAWLKSCIVVKRAEFQ